MAEHSLHQKTSDLCCIDFVWCGSREQRVVKVTQYEERAELVEVRFNPDEPIETHMISPHGILTKGEPMLANSASHLKKDNLVGSGVVRFAMAVDRHKNGCVQRRPCKLCHSC